MPFLVLLLSLSCLAAPTLYLNGKIYLSVYPEMKKASWLLVENGQVKSSGLGSPPEIIVEKISLQGKTVLPGLIDAHAHLLDIGKAKWEVELRGTQSPEAAAERVKWFIQANHVPKGTTVIGKNWDQSAWPEQKYPTRILLDEVSNLHPILLYRVDGHAAWVNTLALKSSGIWKSKGDPEGGKIIRDKRTEPTGILIDNGMDKLDLLIKSFTPAQVTQYATEAIRQAHELGITGIHDAGIKPQYATVIRELVKKDPTRFRYYGMVSGSKLPKPIFNESDSTFALRTVKLYIDGAMGSRGAAFDLPYQDDPANSGLLMMSEEKLTEKIREANRLGYQIAIHAIGSKGNQVAVNALEKALGKTIASKRPRLEHAQVLTADLLVRIKKLGILASMQPTHCTSDMKWVEDRIGKERARYAYAWRSLLDAGIPLAFGSDAPVEWLNPWHGLYAAVTRQDSQNKPEGGFYPMEKITLAEAYRAFTEGAAFASFAENNLGTLEAGRAADFIVTSKNPFEIPIRDLRDLTVEGTFVGGVLVYQKPQKPS